MPLILLAILSGLIATAGRAEEGTLTFYVQSFHPGIVDVEFYSQDYNTAWPGDGEVFSLDDSAVHDVTLSCEVGEKICYGAWERRSADKEWGVGRDDRHGCGRCCYICDGGETPILVLE